MGLSSESILQSNYFLSIYENSFFFKNPGMSEESMEEIMRKFKELHPDFEDPKITRKHRFFRSKNPNLS